MADETTPDKAPRLARPTTKELAVPKGAGGSIAGRTFLELLHPSDPVLMSKGARDYRLYRETLRDDQCSATFSDRRLAVTSKETIVDAASEDPLDVAAADFIREEIARVGWDRITDGMLYARWYGHAVAECLYYVDGERVRLKDIKVRNRSRFLYDTDGAVWLLGNNGQWERMPDRKFWTVSVGADNDDEPFGLGLAHYCYWPVFFKRNDLKFWLVFTEKFGSPTALGSIPAGKWNDEALKDAVLDALLQFSSEAAIVVPEEATVTLLEAARSGSGTYDELYDRMDAALAKLIVGQTASSAGTPGRLGNEELQSQVRDDLVKADADLVCASFNNGPCTWLTQWNFPGAKAPKVWRKVEPDEDLKSAADTDTAISALGFEPSEQYVQERYGAHWTKKEPLNLGAGQGMFGAQPNRMPEAGEFAEAGAIALLKAGGRGDQDAMKRAAQFLASTDTPIAARLQEILAYAEEAQDYDTMKAHIQRMVQELPTPQAVERMRNATFFGRLLGLFRGQA